MINRYPVKRFLKLSLLFSCASLLTLGCLGNIFAYDINFDYVKHIMSMSDTFHHPVVMLRAVNNPTYYHVTYILIILSEALASILLWLGIYHCLKNITQSNKQFEKAKYWGEIGLLFSLFLYIFGFFFVAGEWFASWQSVKWNAKSAAMPFIVTLGLTYLIFTQQEKDEV